MSGRDSRLSDTVSIARSRFGSVLTLCVRIRFGGCSRTTRFQSLGRVSSRSDSPFDSSSGRGRRSGFNRSVVIRCQSDARLPSATACLVAPGFNRSVAVRVVLTNAVEDAGGRSGRRRVSIARSRSGCSDLAWPRLPSLDDLPTVSIARSRFGSFRLASSS